MFFCPTSLLKFLQAYVFFFSFYFWPVVSSQRLCSNSTTIQLCRPDGLTLTVTHLFLWVLLMLRRASAVNGSSVHKTTVNNDGADTGEEKAGGEAEWGSRISQVSVCATVFGVCVTCSWSHLAVKEGCFVWNVGDPIEMVIHKYKVSRLTIFI